MRKTEFFRSYRNLGWNAEAKVRGLWRYTQSKLLWRFQDPARRVLFFGLVGGICGWFGWSARRRAAKPVELTAGGIEGTLKRLFRFVGVDQWTTLFVDAFVQEVTPSGVPVATVAAVTASQTLKAASPFRSIQPKMLSMHKSKPAATTSSEDFLNQTIKRLQPLSPDSVLTREDARQTVENNSGFFSVLRGWTESADRTRKARADGAGADAPTDALQSGTQDVER